MPVDKLRAVAALLNNDAARPVGVLGHAQTLAQGSEIPPHGGIVSPPGLLGVGDAGRWLRNHLTLHRLNLCRSRSPFMSAVKEPRSRRFFYRWLS